MDDRITSIAASRMLGLTNAYVYLLVSESLNALKKHKVLCLNANPIPFVEYDEKCLTLPHERPLVYYFSHSEILDFISKRDSKAKKIKSKVDISINLDLYKSITKAYSIIHGKVL